jgi:hypothetical protein
LSEKCGFWGYFDNAKLVRYAPMFVHGAPKFVQYAPKFVPSPSMFVRFSDGFFFDRINEIFYLEDHEGASAGAMPLNLKETAHSRNKFL